MSSQTNNEDSFTAAPEKPVVPFFRKPRSKNFRKRAADDASTDPNPFTDSTSQPTEQNDDDDAIDNTVAAPLKKKSKSNALGSFTTGNVASRRAAQEQQQQDLLSRAGPVVYSASGTAASLVSDSATRTLDVDGAEEVEEDRRKRAMLAADALARGVAVEGVDDAPREFGEELYTGQSGYKEWVNKKTDNTTQSNANRIRAGPLRGPTNVRISCRFDYQPDICKDYKETGYCGYGDSCKFMHDRGDYKTGWQLEKEWEEEQRQKKAQGWREEDDYLIREEGDKLEEVGVDEDDELPFACLICRKEFKNPVVTRCGHYFCESCALKFHVRSPKCYACNAPTYGTFSVATELMAKLKAKKERMEKQAAEIKDQNKELEEELQVED